jgi:Poly(ADP-ribose) polymerase and DNA-Ligase Zn-finger region
MAEPELQHVIEVAKTGRARCRGCRQAIAKGELRFGEAVKNDFDPSGGSSLQWYHLKCGAERRPALVQPALAAFAGEVPDRAAIEQALAQAAASAPPSYPFAERATTGRSRCVHCEGAIEKDTWRVAFEREIDAGGFTRKGPSYPHARCAGEYLQDLDVYAKLAAHSRLAPQDLEALRAELGAG